MLLNFARRHDRRSRFAFIDELAVVHATEQL